MSYSIRIISMITFLTLCCLSVVYAQESNNFYKEVSKMNNKYWEGGYISSIILTVGSENIKIGSETGEIDPGRGTTPIIVNSRVMLPIRSIIEAVGGNVEYDETNQKVTVNLKEYTVALWIGKHEIVANGINKETEVAPFIENGRTMLPLRMVSENMGFKVDWIEESQRVYLRRPYQLKRLIIKTKDSISISGYGEIESINIDNMVALQFDSELKTEAAMVAITSLPNIEYVEPDTVVDISF